MYLANETIKRALKKDHILAILVHVFKCTPQRTAKKAESLNELKKQVETSPTLLSTAEAVVELALVPPLPPPPPPPVTAVAMADDLKASNNGLTPPVQSSPIQPLQAATRANNSNVHWLYFHVKMLL